MRFFGSVAAKADFTPPTIEAPWQGTEGDLTVALQGGPVWLDGAFTVASTADLLTAYRGAGTRFLARLSGRFALAIIDRSAGRVVLALDRMGIERLAYAACGNRIVFSTSAEEVARDPSVNARLRTQALFDYLLLHMVPAPATAFEGVYKLRAGTVAVFERGRTTVERYWTPEFATRDASFDELRQGLLDGLRSSVAACNPDDHTGAFLSGGLDSSTVAGMLGAVTDRSPRTFSIGFGVDEFNELDYARIAVRRFGATSVEYAVSADDIVSAFQDIAGAYDEPFGNSSAVPTYFCAKIAREHGIEHLLAGDGGDELFGGNERYARQRIFEAYWRVPQAIRAGLIEPVSRVIDAESRFTPLRKARSYVDQARIPMPERLESWNYMYRIDLAAMLEAEFRSTVDTRAPLRGMAEVYAQTPSDVLMHRMLFFDWQYTLSDNDLRKVGTMCALAGIRVSYPMLDPRIIDLSLRVPPKMMMNGLELRSFYKRALRGFLPDEILDKTKHGFGLPFGVWLKTHRRLGELIYGLLGDLKRRGIVQPAFIDNLIVEHRQGHPGYFGYAIWDLAMLEAWLQAHPEARL
jgi:asparagine synthase (glutamine-hydrolysing)